MQIVGFVVFVVAWKEIIFPAAVCKFYKYILEAAAAAARV
jgi:hypothetical protein